MRLSSISAQIALAAALACGLPSSVVAQTRVVKTPSAVLASPKGRTVGSVHPGVELRVLETRGAYVRVSLAGFVERARLTAQRGNGGTRVGRRSATIRSRAATSARSVASLDAGTTVTLGKGAAPKGWVRVSRTGWVLGSALRAPSAPPTVARAGKSTSRSSAASRTAAARPAAKSATKTATKTGTNTAAKTAPNAATTASVSSSKPSATRTASPPAARASGGEVESAVPGSARTAATTTAAAATPATLVAPLSDSSLVPTANVALRAAPDARALATIAQGTTLVPLARERGWVRVRVEGWVAERDLAPADTAVRSAVSAADLRADPQGSKGRLVRWTVQVLARQTADPLRRDLAPDETYLLARGPAEENALLYLVVPPAMLESTKDIPALSDVLITARVRTGKSELVGVPILDLLTLTPRK